MYACLIPISLILIINLSFFFAGSIGLSQESVPREKTYNFVNFVLLVIAGLIFGLTHL